MVCSGSRQLICIKTVAFRTRLNTKQEVTNHNNTINEVGQYIIHICSIIIIKSDCAVSCNFLQHVHEERRLFFSRNLGETILLLHSTEK